MMLGAYWSYSTAQTKPYFCQELSWSPDGSKVAFSARTEKEPYEIYTVNADGSGLKQITNDTTEDYWTFWSTDGKKIAFVMRENPEEESANQLSDSLISNIYIVEVESGALMQVTHLENSRVETPLWSPDGNTLAFNVVINDRMEVRIAEMTTGEIRSLMMEPACCPAWMRR